MAGIGFELRKVIKEGSNISKISAVTQSVFVSSGNWIISIISIISIGLHINKSTTYDQFMAIAIYTFVFSMILTTPFLSDKLFAKEEDSVIPILNASLLFIGSLSFIIAYSYIHFFTGIKEFDIVGARFFTSVSLLWTVMIFISTLKDYSFIFYSFLLGSIFSVCSVYIYSGNDLHFILDLYSFGFLLTTGFLIMRLLVEFPKSNKLLEFGFLKIRRFRILFMFLSTTFILGGTWIDKIIYWWQSDLGVVVVTGFKFYPIYDTVMFLSFLTTIPVLAYFTVFIETDLYEKQSNFLFSIESGSVLNKILDIESILNNSFKTNLFKILMFQLVVSSFFILVSGYIVSYFNINPLYAPMFRIGLLIVLLQLILNIVVIFLYYFDYQKEVLLISVVFFLSNTLLTEFVFLPMGELYVGYSYFLSLILSIFTAALVSLYKIRYTLYYIFMENKI